MIIDNYGGAVQRGHTIIVNCQLSIPIAVLITASIVTYRTDRTELAHCLQSLEGSAVAEIYVCDNSPSDDLKDFCQSWPKVTYIFNNANLGYGSGHNVALRRSMAAHSDYHLVINSDVYFDCTAIEKITEYMEQNPDVAQLIPNVVYPDGRLQYVCRLLPTPANLIFRRFLPKKMVTKMNRRYLLEFWDHRSPANVPYHQGSFMFFRTRCLEEVGLFDEQFFMYPEDIDITRRMHRRYRTMFWPGVTIVHAHRASSYTDPAMLRIHITNMIRYFNKWGWLIDGERRRWNRRLLAQLGYHKQQ